MLLPRELTDDTPAAAAAAREAELRTGSSPESYTFLSDLGRQFEDKPAVSEGTSPVHSPRASSPANLAVPPRDTPKASPVLPSSTTAEGTQADFVPRQMGRIAEGPSSSPVTGTARALLSPSKTGRPMRPLSQVLSDGAATDVCV